MIKDQYLIDKLKEKELKILDKIYLDYKDDFFLYAKTFSIPNEDIYDLYQEIIISLYENVQLGKLTNLSSTLKTYLFAIGKNKIYKLLNKANRLNSNHTVIHADSELCVFDIETNDEQQEILKSAFEELGGKCQEILTLYYYEGQNLDDIQNTLGYSSKDVLKSQKSRCLKKLKECVKKKI